MISFKCKNCGGEVIISRTGDVLCPYCGNTYTFSNSELTEYKSFRRRMLEYLRAVADSGTHDEDRELLWNQAETVTFMTEDGAPVTIKYLYESVVNNVHMYAARENVIYIYPKEMAAALTRADSMRNKLEFPAADIKGLDRCFPVFVGMYNLENGARMAVYKKSEDVYPLAMFGNLPGMHMAWIISRLENIACVLEYSNLSHNAISEETVFINPRTHEAVLMGGWENAEVKTCTPNHNDLRAIRHVAQKVIGPLVSSLPEMYKNFLNAEPKEDAYADFAAWDRVIEVGMGGHNFTKFDMNEYL